MQQVSKITIAFGVVLIVLGVGAYFATGQQSWTALIPSIFGVPFVALGAVAVKGSDKVRMHTMHATVLLALIGCVMTFKGILGTIQHMGGAEIARPEAAYVRAIMSVLCVVYVVLCVKSFIDARRQRAAGAAGG
jgi:hypothetical protein